jgi:protein CWC15
MLVPILFLVNDIFRQSGQTSQDELNRLDLKAQLLKAEQDHYVKVNKVTRLASGLSNSFKDDDDDDDDNSGGSQKKAIAEDDSSSTETPLERKRRLLKEAERLDKDDSDSDGPGKNSDSDSNSNSDSDR